MGKLGTGGEVAMIAKLRVQVGRLILNVGEAKLKEQVLGFIGECMAFHRARLEVFLECVNV